MNEQHVPPTRAGRQDAIDINDFVYAATGAQVRRLTLPDGTHWFPAADVATRLGYANTRQALLWHVPEPCTMTLSTLAQSVYGVDARRKIAGHGLKKSMRMVNLEGIVSLVNACTKPEAEPFKRWVTEVIISVQRDGSYALERSAVQPASPDAPAAYAMPREVAEAIVRLEERNLRLDEEWIAAQHEQVRLREESLRLQQGMAHAMDRIAESVERLAARLTPSERREADGVPPSLPRLTADEVLAGWRKRLVVTDDVWAVAATIAPGLADGGEAPCRLDAIAQRTGLTSERVRDCLRMLLRRGCVRQTGAMADGAPLYVLNRP